MYRLNVFPIELPPLRQRLTDVPLLAERFLDLIGKQEGRSKTLSPEALRQLSEHDWPGNVRELRNAVQRAYVMATGNVIDAQWLPHRNEAPAPTTPAPSKILLSPRDEEGDDFLTIPLGTTLAQAEQAIILATLRHYSHQKERTAAALGISLKTLYNRLKLYTADEHAGDNGPR
jgi:DNA-binding NtrC family response regulator